MANFITALCATLCIMTLAIYDFLCICRILEKEHWGEKLFKSLFPNIEYNETLLYVMIRPTILTLSLLMYLGSFRVITQFPFFQLLLTPTPILAMLCTFKGINKK